MIRQTPTLQMKQCHIFLVPGYHILGVRLGLISIHETMQCYKKAYLTSIWLHESYLFSAIDLIHNLSFCIPPILNESQLYSHECIDNEQVSGA